MEQFLHSLDFEQIHSTLIVFLLIFARLLAFISGLPLLGGNLLPSLLKVGLALLLSAIFFSATNAPHSKDLNSLSELFLIFLFAKEVFLGFLLGFLCSLVIYVFECAGQIIDAARSANMARLLVPQMREQSSTSGNLFFQLALILSIFSGLYRPIFAALGESFNLFPVTQIPFQTSLSFDLLELVLSTFVTMWKIAFMIASPVILISLIVDLAFGFLNRAAPQIQAYFMSLPVKTTGGLLIVLLTLPLIVDGFDDFAKQVLGPLFRFLK